MQILSSRASILDAQGLISNQIRIIDTLIEPYEELMKYYVLKSDQTPKKK